MWIKPVRDDFDLSGAVVAQGQPHSLGPSNLDPVAREPLRLETAWLQWMARIPFVPHPCPQALHSACWNAKHAVGS